MSKLIGIITAWAAEPFIEPAIKQAIEYCDEILVSVSANNSIYDKFEDSTLDIVKKYVPDVKIIEGVKSTTHPNSKGLTMKKMLDETNNNKKGDWIWILDADEFYFDDDVNIIKDVIKENKYSMIEMPERFFLVNMQNYVNLKRTRLKKIMVDNLSFRTNKMSVEGSSTFIDTPLGMHHYSFLTNMDFKREFWKHHYGGVNASIQKRIDWLDKIYLELELDNQQKYIDLCKKMFNEDHILGPHFSKEATNNGFLYEYNGKQPKFINPYLYEQDDFRKFYNS